MKDQDKRAVEGMARCGISLEGLIDACVVRDNCVYK